MTDVTLLLVLGLTLGLVIGLVVKAFGVEPDERVEEIEGLLPGANCGACGFAGCGELARHLASGDAEPTACPGAAPEAIARIAEILGVAAGERTKQVAVVRCGGDDTLAVQAALYNGVADCKDAVQVAGGSKGCIYGCLGLGSCSRACPFGAIEMTNGLAIVHADLCTGCGKCVATCPRNLIELVPASAPIHVYCNSPEKGGAKRKVCKASCIGCRKCVKEAGDEGGMEMKGFLAHVDYTNPPPATLAAVCPTKCLHGAAGNGDEATQAQETEVVDG
jgi:electron transport complex protein RnfB